MTDKSIPAPTPPKSSGAPVSFTLPNPTVKPTSVSPAAPIAQVPAPASITPKPVAPAAPLAPAMPLPTPPKPPTPPKLPTPSSSAPVSLPKVSLPPSPPPTVPSPTLPTSPTSSTSPMTSTPPPMSASMSHAAPPGLGGLPKPPSSTSLPTSALPANPAKSTLPPQLPKPPQPSQPKPAQPAEYKQSPLRFLPIIVGVLVILGLAFFVYQRLFGQTARQSVAPSDVGTQSKVPTTNTITPTTGQPVTLTYWGLWEPSQIIQDVLDDFHKQNPNITVNYQQQSYQDVRERLQTAIASGQGPDVFRFHASWTPMLRNELTPMPATVYSQSDFQNTFYPVASQQLSLNGQMYGVPLMYDGLALYYNSDALRAANLQPPKTWADVKAMAPQLTIRTGGKIDRAGFAAGNSTNVDHFSDIIGLLILQNGGDLTNPTSQPTLDAMTFYTNFVKNDKVWDATLPNSTVAFARGDVAMMLAPSWRALDIKALNPNLKFGVTQLPQLSSNQVTWASYWAEGVSSQSKHQTEAWQLIKYLSSADVMRKLYSNASKNRPFGELYSRRDLANDLASDPIANPYLSDAPNAKGWYMSSATHDNGINDQIIKYYADAVTAILGGSSVKEAMSTVALGVNQVLRQYGVGASSAASNTAPLRSSTSSP